MNRQFIGGQSGGALFHAETGALIGITNWTSRNGGGSLLAESFADELAKRIAEHRGESAESR